MEVSEIVERMEHEESRLAEQRGRTLFEQIQHKRVVDDQAFRELGALLRRAKELRDAIAPRFDKPVSSAHKAHQEACKLRDDALDPFDEAEKLAKEKLANYIVTHGGQMPETDGISYVTLWKFEITEEGQLPREYLKADEKKLGAVVSRLKGQTRIPGVKVMPVIQIKAFANEPQA